jgi:hypothetical protein
MKLPPTLVLPQIRGGGLLATIGLRRLLAVMLAPRSSYRQIIDVKPLLLGVRGSTD